MYGHEEDVVCVECCAHKILAALVYIHWYYC